MNQKDMDLQTASIVRESMLTVLAGSCGITRDEAEHLYLKAYTLIPFDHAPCTTNQVALLLHTFSSFADFEAWLIPRIQVCKDEADINLICTIAWED
ncbi:hypothetical protein ACQ4M3_00875 [Leptolyngbya sp. AN03gr2]|uniref:hypothetical protein n=1 Tax=unclassified Leptolyngbya TaxID=2650499 RepID=UPI003D324629